MHRVLFRGGQRSMHQFACIHTYFLEEICRILALWQYNSIISFSHLDPQEIMKVP
jgi:hypothetical protein